MDNKTLNTILIFVLVLAFARLVVDVYSDYSARQCVLEYKNTDKTVDDILKICK